MSRRPLRPFSVLERVDGLELPVADGQAPQAAAGSRIVEESPQRLEHLLEPLAALGRRVEVRQGVADVHACCAHRHRPLLDPRAPSGQQGRARRGGAVGAGRVPPCPGDGDGLRRRVGGAPCVQAFGDGFGGGLDAFYPRGRPCLLQQGSRADGVVLGLRGHRRLEAADCRFGAGCGFAHRVGFIAAVGRKRRQVVPGLCSSSWFQSLPRLAGRRRRVKSAGSSRKCAARCVLRARPRRRRRPSTMSPGRHPASRAPIARGRGIRPRVPRARRRRRSRPSCAGSPSDDHPSDVCHVACVDQW